MYVGRIVAIGKNKSGKICALYRVSSRSFPNREAKNVGENIAILPRAGFEDDIKKNPFIAYNCLSIVNNYAVVSNGTHTDLLALKLRENHSIRDTLVTILHTFDYEHDALDTPRIAAIADRNTGTGYLGIITKNSLHVRHFELNPGTAFYVATYEHNVPDEHLADQEFHVETAQKACGYILNRGIFSTLEKPVTAACALEDESGNFNIAIANAQ